SRTDHVLLVPHHRDSLPDSSPGQRVQIPGQQHAPSQRDEALGPMLSERPQPFPNPCRQDNRFHERTTTVSSTCWKAARKPSRSCSVKAPMFATRKILDSSFPCPA